MSVCDLGRETDSRCFLLHHFPRILSLELIVFYIIGVRCLISSFHVVSDFSITICWKCSSFPMELSWHFNQNSSDHWWKSSSLRSLFCFVALVVCVYAVAMRFCLPLLLTGASQVAENRPASAGDTRDTWVLKPGSWVLQLCFLSRLFWLFWFPCIFMNFRMNLSVYAIQAARIWIGEGNGTPLQYSCLENPTDGGNW